MFCITIYSCIKRCLASAQIHLLDATKENNTLIEGAIEKGVFAVRRYFVLRLASELADLRTSYANPATALQGKNPLSLSHKIKIAPSLKVQ